MKKDVIEAFNTLANIAGGVIYDGKFIEREVVDVKVNHINYDTEQEFYCLTVPSSAFVVKSENKVSVTGNCHSLAGAHAFRIAVTECKEEDILTVDQVKELQRAIVKGAKELKEHEYRIIEMIFAKGKIDGITERDMKTFIKSRINLCLNNLGIDSIYDINDNPIGRWFYDNITMPTIHDFFYALGSQYHRDWAESDFKVEANTYTFSG